VATCWYREVTTRDNPSFDRTGAGSGRSSTAHLAGSWNPSQRSRVLEEDGDLADAIPLEERSAAIEYCVADVTILGRGNWEGQQEDMTPAGIGLLVLGGLLIRRVGVHGGFGAELLGQGDLLRPWQGERTTSSLSRTTGWRVLEPARIAVLDHRAAARFARYPQLTGRLVARALERSRNLATMMAIAHHTRIDVRLHMLFWHLADRWGRVRPDGVLVPLRLTHEMLADLVAARRPSVSTSLADLARRGLVQRDGLWFKLSGEPPGELLELQRVRVPLDDS
jgi:CRP/FNR family transcriptional regulator, cyclic AMP receptor protein